MNRNANIVTVSIITPIYNSEKYLENTIRSVINQTYGNWELILVDDGSTDSSGEICDMFARMDCRIKSYHISNGGVGRARNYGLEKSTGEFVVFLDSDDLLDYSFLNILIKKMNEPGVDMVGCLSATIDNKLSSYSYIIKKGEYIYLTDGVRDKIPEIFNYVVWGKLFKRDIIRKYNIQFSKDLTLSEDTLFFQEYSLTCNKMMVYTGSLIGYRVVPNSLSRKRIIPSPFVQNIIRYNLLVEFIKDYDIKSPMNKKVIDQCLRNIIESLLKSANYKDEFKLNCIHLKEKRDLYQQLLFITRLCSRRIQISMWIVKRCKRSGFLNVARLLVRLIYGG